MHLYTFPDIPAYSTLTALDLSYITVLVDNQIKRYQSDLIQDYTQNSISIRTAADQCIQLISIQRKLKDLYK